ncbi:hypothetical protein CLPU_8c00440 [Gottschalkia purinilytica]|uniref:Stage 0 sporulation protein A homolog n=1 Tax=Gottschalkia purinilytica TaxID=1503 RepID=A0A0L0W9R8_GOTPU|nr:response regulator transcription factor [Gottschalkia purinilytica]KNF08279.1 hypothetical protein CLPU_8c00440 [Gottschalkia purinilytica]
MEKLAILLVEDDKEINNLIFKALQEEGYNVIQAFDGLEGFKMFNEDVSLVLLDVMLPYINGIEVMKKIRQESNVPIILLSAKDEESDIVRGLEFGGDDYISKPFSILELKARVNSRLRRNTNYNISLNKEKQIKIGNVILDLDRYILIRNNEKIGLTPKELKTLKLLMNNPKKVFTKTELFELVWNEPYYDNDNIINVHIRRLRKKIENNPDNPEIITTLWGIGYRLGDLI